MSQAIIDPTARIGRGTVIWGHTKIREDAQIGEDYSLGIGVYVGPGVLVGSQVLIQNGAQIYEPAIIGQQVFIGPNVVLTNDRLPKAVDRNGNRQKELDWQKPGVNIGRGASIGANSVCISPVTIGTCSMVGAGSVVTRSIPDFALHYGNSTKFPYSVVVTGKKLIQESDVNFSCPDTVKRDTLENPNLLVRQ